MSSSPVSPPPQSPPPQSPPTQRPSSQSPSSQASDHQTTPHALDSAALGEAPEREAQLAPERAFRESCGSFWVFGYGSLMWRPGFDYAERRPARLRGFARSFCLWSVRYRGTPQAPGLVLGLRTDPSAVTHGVALRVEATTADATRAYLIERELISAAYRETVVALEPRDGEDSVGDRAGCELICALTYVVDPTHPQYAGVLSAEEQARIIARSAGPMGPNREYLFNTLAHLREVGVPEEELAEFDVIARQVREGPAPTGSAGR